MPWEIHSCLFSVCPRVALIVQAVHWFTPNRNQADCNCVFKFHWSKWALGWFLLCVSVMWTHFEWTHRAEVWVSVKFVSSCHARWRMSILVFSHKTGSLLALIWFDLNVFLTSGLANLKETNCLNTFFPTSQKKHSEAQFRCCYCMTFLSV